MKRVQHTFKPLVCLGLAALLVSLVWTPASYSASQGNDDAAITEQVRAAIFHEPVLRTAFLNVDTDAGVVQLTGSVERPFDLAVATGLARNTPGVVKVQNEFVVVRDHTAHGK